MKFRHAAGLPQISARILPGIKMGASARRQQLTEGQIATLFDPLTEPRQLVRHYTLTETDSAMIRRRRGDHSRLGYALMLCYLRHPGRPLRTNERPAALVTFVAEQIAMCGRKPSMII